MLEGAEKNIQSARQLLREIIGESGGAMPKAVDKAKILSIGAISGGGKVIEGVFDGQNMMGPDGKKYPVPANYASKSKLVEGDVLKLTISDDGSFIYKQIGPVERKKMIGILTQGERGDYRVITEGKTHKVLLASLTYYKAEPGDEVTIVVPKDQESEWAAVENVIKKAGDNSETGQPAEDNHSSDLDQDLELSGE